MTVDAARVLSRKPLQRKVLRFEVLSPVHVGAREGRLLPMEYIVAGGRVYIIDDERFGRFLLQTGGSQLIDHFIQAARTGELGKGVDRFLQDKAKVTEAKMREVAERISSYHVDGGSPDMRDLRPFVRDGFGRVYIPGTSLKGVFRTAVLYGILKADALRTASLEKRLYPEIKKLNGAGKGKERMKKFLSQELIQKDLLQSFDLKSAKQPQNKDLLRCFKVRDAYPLDGTLKTKAVKIDFLSKKKDGAFYWSEQKKSVPGGSVDTGKPLSVYAEAIVAGIFETELLWDHQLFEVFQRENSGVSSWAVTGLEDLLKASSNMLRDLAQHETRFFEGSGNAARASLQRWYGAMKGDFLRIGFGSGMLGTTVNLLWSDALRQEIRNVCGQYDRKDDPAPKSRRVWKQGGENWLPMGWVRIVGENEPVEDLVGRVREKVSRISGLPAIPEPHRAFPTVPRVRAQPLEEAKVSATGLLAQAKSISLEQSFNLRRLVDAMDRLDPAEAHTVASILKQRLEEAGRWKKHPLRGEIEVFIQE